MTSAELRQLKNATEKLTKWESSGKAFGHYQVLEPNATNTAGADRIYEYYCLMKILNDLKANYTVILKPSIRAGNIFPGRPANKVGWAYFVIENKKDKTNKFQVCYGTKIKLSTAPKTKIAPDITFQKSSSTNDPDETMVELIMDAKFKYNADHALTIEQIHAFIQRVNALQTTGAGTINLVFNSLGSLKSNCLLTNGCTVDRHQQYCVNSRIKQVGRFDSKGSPLVIIG